jgi:hypothetical protein
MGALNEPTVPAPAGAVDGPQPAEESKRTVSTISFPYMDLEAAVAVAKGVHAVGGTSCQIDQLAAQLDQKADNSAFRLQVNTARIFGLAVYAQSCVTLTSLGARICDPQQEQAATIEAFLTVPLYKSLHEQFRGRTLPPNKGLESTMASLGVAQKQTDKARQVFQRAAQQAGFFWKGQDRLVAPPTNGSRADVQQQSDGQSDLQEEKPKRRSGGDDGDGGGRLHPLIEGLIKSLPKDLEEPWAIEKRAKWLRAASQNFDLIYPDTGEDFIEIKVQKGTK